jgi:hypothetical protein
MVHLQRKALCTGLATALTLVATAAPAQPLDPQSTTASSTQSVSDLRSPDTRDVAAGRQIVATGPPTWPSSPQPLANPRAASSAPSSGLDWGSAGIGAAAVLGALAITAAGILGLRRRRIPRPGSLTAR